MALFSGIRRNKRNERRRLELYLKIDRVDCLALEHPFKKRET